MHLLHIYNETEVKSSVEVFMRASMQLPPKFGELAWKVLGFTAVPSICLELLGSLHLADHFIIGFLCCEIHYLFNVVTVLIPRKMSLVILVI